ncbi:methylenetetrahydrofolate reductase, partial [Stenotrophomonas maltophilia]
MSAPTSLREQAFLDAFSLEESARAMPALAAEATRIPRGTTISHPSLASEDDDARLAAAR